MNDKKEWYQVVREEIVLQGDLLMGCPIIEPLSKNIESGEIDAEVVKYNVIVMSQSCDLVSKKIDLVLLCPFYSLSKAEEKYHFLSEEGGKETLRRGNSPGYHLLNKCEITNFNHNYLIVDFRSTFSLPLGIVLDFVKTKEDRLRLDSPYREHLSQAFARFFMRVGLPIDIPPFEEKVIIR